MRFILITKSSIFTLILLLIAVELSACAGGDNSSSDNHQGQQNSSPEYEEASNVLYVLDTSSEDHVSYLIDKALTEAEDRGEIVYYFLEIEWEADDVKQKVEDEVVTFDPNVIFASGEANEYIQNIMAESLLVDLERLFFEEGNIPSVFIATPTGWISVDSNGSFTGLLGVNGDSPLNLDDIVDGIIGVRSQLEAGAMGGPGGDRVGAGSFWGIAIKVLHMAHWVHVAHGAYEIYKMLDDMGTAPDAGPPAPRHGPPEPESGSPEAGENSDGGSTGSQDAGAPKSDENDPKKPNEKTKGNEPDETGYDFLIFLNEFIEDVLLDEVLVQMVNGTLPPEHTDVDEEFIQWLEESIFEAQPIRLEEPLPEEDDTGYAYLYWLWQISTGQIDTASPTWWYLWKQGFPIDPVESPARIGKTLFVGGQYQPATDTLKLSFLK